MERIQKLMIDSNRGFLVLRPWMTLGLDIPVAQLADIAQLARASSNS